LKERDMKKQNLRLAIVTAATLLVPATAMAHPALYQHTHGFLEGVQHPLTGLDHLLAMIAVGLWASQKGGRAMWLWPASFVGAMVVGGALGMSGLALPGIEPAIATSLLVLGLMIAVAGTMPVWMGIAVIALFGLFHGNAHGLEAPVNAGGLLYAAGFVAATAALHALGLTIGLAARQGFAQGLVRVGAAAIAVTGCVFFFV
jgi:urease accessory protein